MDIVLVIPRKRRPPTPDLISPDGPVAPKATVYDSSTTSAPSPVSVPSPHHNNSALLSSTPVDAQPIQTQCTRSSGNSVTVETELLGESAPSTATISATPISQTIDKKTVRGSSRSAIPKKDELGSVKCCLDQHMSKLFDALELKKIREDFNADVNGRPAEKQFLFDYFRDHQLPDGEIFYQIRGRLVCQAAFRFTLGLTKTRFSNIKNAFLSGERMAIHGLKGMEKAFSKEYMCRAFLEEYFSQHCDSMPEKNERHMPEIMSRQGLYDEYKSLSPDALSHSRFRSILKSYFPDVRFPKTSRFTRCDKCANFMALSKQNSKSDYEATTILEINKSKHMLRQGNARLEMDRRAQQAIQYPSMFGCIITDGAAQDNFQMPRCNLNPSGLSKEEKLQVHVFGAYMFGQELVCFVDYDQFHHDTNFNITSILTLLYDRRDSLPKYLHIQLDNTQSQNKNQIFFAFCAFLVASKRILEITLGFLLKGHTHCIIDQIFSRMAIAMAEEPRGVLTLSQLKRTLESSWKRYDGATLIEPQVRFTSRSYNFDDWLKPVSNGVSHLRGRHQFRFFLDEQGICQLQSKTFVEDNWEKDMVQMLRGLPDGEPAVVLPENSRVEVKKIRHTISTGRRLGMLTESEENEWTEFLNGLESDVTEMDDTDDGPSMLEAIRLAREGEGEREPQPDPSDPDRTDLPPVMTTAQKRIYDKERRFKNQISGVAPEEIEKDKFCVMVPDVEWCVEQYQQGNTDFSPIKLPWIGKIQSAPDSNGDFLVRFHDGSFDGNWWPSTNWREYKKVNCQMVYFVFNKLTNTKKLGLRVQTKIKAAYAGIEAEFREQLDID